MNNEKKFVIPELEIVAFSNEDIITWSGEGDVGDDDYSSIL